MTAKKIARIFFVSLLALVAVSCADSKYENKFESYSKPLAQNDNLSLMDQLVSLPSPESNWPAPDLDAFESNLHDLLLVDNSSPNINIDVRLIQLVIEKKLLLVKFARIGKLFVKISDALVAGRFNIFLKTHNKVMNVLADRKLAIISSYNLPNSNGISSEKLFTELVSVQEKYKSQYGLISYYRDKLLKIEGTDPEKVDEVLGLHIANLKLEMNYLLSLIESQNKLKLAHKKMSFFDSETLESNLYEIRNTAEIYSESGDYSLSLHLMNLPDLYSQKVLIHELIIQSKINAEELESKRLLSPSNLLSSRYSAESLKILNNFLVRLNNRILYVKRYH